MPGFKKHMLKNLYLKGHSMKEISNILGSSENKVVYWMNKYKIKRRSLSEASYVKQNPNGDPFKIKKSLSPQEKNLLGLGIGIYMGEGNKKSIHTTSVSNTDPLILNIFLTFLIKICGVKQQKIHYSLVCFNDSSPTKAKNYWQKALKTKPQNFGKIVQVPPQGKGIYKSKSAYGVCTVGVSNIKLKKWILNEIKQQARVV